MDVAPCPSETARSILRTRERTMLKGGILWMLGVPGIIVILLLLFGIL
jgi:hypothetical protein